MNRSKGHRPVAVEVRAEILWNPEVAPGYRRMAWPRGEHLRPPRPDSSSWPAWVRPRPGCCAGRFRFTGGITVNGRGGIELLYREVGPTTRAMAMLAPGAGIDLIGPLGRGFSVPETMGRLALVAGGIGVAPIVFLAETLAARPGGAGSTTVFLGGRCRGDLLCRDDFERLGLPVTVTTDDGSAGDRCLVTMPLAAAAAASPPELICACGPPAMLHCVADIATAGHIACQVSVETLMACGMGACLGCAVTDRRPAAPYLHACRDGPVFDAQRLEWPIKY